MKQIKEEMEKFEICLSFFVVSLIFTHHLCVSSERPLLPAYTSIDGESFSIKSHMTPEYQVARRRALLERQAALRQVSHTYKIPMEIMRIIELLARHENQETCHITLREHTSASVSRIIRAAAIGECNPKSLEDEESPILLQPKKPALSVLTKPEKNYYEQLKLCKQNNIMSFECIEKSSCSQEVLVETKLYQEPTFPSVMFMLHNSDANFIKDIVISQEGLIKKIYLNKCYATNNPFGHSKTKYKSAGEWVTIPLCPTIVKVNRLAIYLTTWDLLDLSELELFNERFDATIQAFLHYNDGRKLSISV